MENMKYTNMLLAFSFFLMLLPTSVSKNPYGLYKRDGRKSRGDCLHILENCKGCGQCCCAPLVCTRTGCEYSWCTKFYDCRPSSAPRVITIHCAMNLLIALNAFIFSFI